MTESENQFSDLSIEITKKLTLKTKKDNGVYFTPKSIIEKNLDIIKKIKGFSFKTVLEPSCGSCEYIKYIDSISDNISITGIEFIDEIYQSIKDLKFKNETKIVHHDFINYSNTNSDKYELIIGNPPYFVVSKDKLTTTYGTKGEEDFYDGRPNMFILFLIKAITKMGKNGVLSFILPKNFINCLYYNKLRQHIFDNYTIIDIVDCAIDDQYLETKQDTIIFIFQNIKPSKDYNKKWTMIINDYCIFNTPQNIQKLYELYKGASTLDEQGFDVKVGSIVWNQHKSKLTEDSSNTLLIYNSNIKNNKLELVEYDNPEKKKYIIMEGKTDPLLVLNRGYGKGQYTFNYCLIDIKEPYLIENHLIMIINKNKSLAKTKDELINKYKKIIDSFNNQKTKEFVEIYFGNNAINTTEIKHILPIYI
jgi:hypothetical protein